MEGNRAELAENRLILGQFFSTLLPFPLPQSKQTIMGQNRILAFQIGSYHVWGLCTAIIMFGSKQCILVIISLQIIMYLL